MIFLGIISLLQITLLPGWIFTQIFPPGNRLTRILLSFCLSLVINFQLVFLLTLVGLYTQVSVLVIFILELLLLIYLKKINLRYSFNDLSTIKPDAANKYLTLDDGYTRRLKYAFIATGLFIFFGYWVKILDANPGIFDSWDDVVSWNRWASEWFAGYLPQRTYHYPQLLSTNWSLTYKFMGTDEIQFFAKSIMSLFALGILLIFWDLYAKSKSIWLLLALTLSGWLVQKTVGEYLGRGYADIPVAFYGLCVFYVLYLGLNGYMSVTLSMIISAILLSGAALTKQAGFFMLLPFFVLSYYLLKNSHHSFKKSCIILGLATGICLLSAGPWYFYKEAQIQKGIENSEVSWVTHDIYAGKTRSQRFTDATANFSKRITEFDFLNSFSDHGKNVLTDSFKILFLILILLSALSFYGRIALITVVLPFYLAWACFFSYDLRNISLLLPFLGLCAAIGAIVFLRYFRMLFSFLAGNKLIAQTGIGLIVLLLIAGLSFKYDKKYLLNKEYVKARSLLGDSSLNGKIYELNDSGKLRGNILSGYQLLNYLPVINKYYKGFNYELKNLDSLKSIYRNREPGHQIQYFIFHETSPSEIIEFFNQKEMQGELKEYFRSTAGWKIVGLADEKINN